VNRRRLVLYDAVLILGMCVYLLLFSGCASVGDTRDDHAAGEQHYVPLEINGVDVMCVSASGVERPPDAPIFTAGWATMLCEQVQLRDFAPCVVGGEGDTRNVWCSYPPGYLWRFYQSERSF